MIPRDEKSLSPRVVGDYLKQMKPLFWGVSILPFYMAWSLASKKVYPTYLVGHEFAVFILGILAVGPFLGGATILFNDYCDRRWDSHSRRKVDLPLLKGLIKPRSVLYTSLILFFLAVVLALLVSIWFAFLISICIFLSFIYSSPPVRLKEMPGMDILTNAVGSGVVCSVAGWTVVRPISELPVLWAVLAALGVGAIYIPTTIIDYEPDVKEGIRTIAVRLGKKTTAYLGWACVILANCIIVLMAIYNYIIPLFLLFFSWPVIISEIISYWYFLRRPVLSLNSIIFSSNSE